MTGTRTIFLVTRTSLSSMDSHRDRVYFHEDEHYQPLTPDQGGPVRVPEAAFLTRVEAERERDRRELAARELLNPFWLHWGELESLTSVPEEVFRGQLSDAGLRPPNPVPSQFGDATDWRAWWDVESPGWTDEQLATVWRLLDKVRLFEVVEVELVG